MENFYKLTIKLLDRIDGHILLKTCDKLNIPMAFVYHPKRFAESFPNLQPLEKSMPDLNKPTHTFWPNSWSFGFKAWTWHTWPLWFLYVLCFFWSPHFAPATMTLWLSVSLGSTQLGLCRRWEIPPVFVAKHISGVGPFFRWLSLDKWGKTPIPFLYSNR